MRRGRTADSKGVMTAPFDDAEEATGTPVPLETADRPLTIGQVRDKVRFLGGHQFEAHSRQGRKSLGLYKRGSDEPVLITAAQHANETSGVIGALRAAEILVARPQAHFALVPIENVDGYELHQRLLVQNPRHMQHAARYTASGDDISARLDRTDDERAARLEALRLSGARLHINLHGYPAHEWTRPLSGYLPEGFEMWTIPKGFFLIITHYPGWREVSLHLMQELARRLAEDADLVAFNARQIAATRMHSRAQPFEVIHGIPCFLSEGSQYDVPLTLITEAPDETVYGAEMQRQHTTQMRAVLHSIEIYQDIAQQGSLPSHDTYPTVADGVPSA